jgi:uncharacterized protein YaeQ
LGTATALFSFRWRRAIHGAARQRCGLCEDGPLALTATIHHFDIDLADHGRGVFESLALTVARHPSESEDYLWTRVLAFALEYTDGIEFSRGGLSQTEEPPIAVRDRSTGDYRAWIDVGLPDADRLHKAAKSADRVVIYAHRDPTQWLQRLQGARIHRAEEIELLAMDRTLLDGLSPHLARRVGLGLSISDRELHLSFDSASLAGRLTALHMP